MHLSDSGGAIANIGLGFATVVALVDVVTFVLALSLRPSNLFSWRQWSRLAPIVSNFSIRPMMQLSFSQQHGDWLLEQSRWICCRGFVSLCSQCFNGDDSG